MSSSLTTGSTAPYYSHPLVAEVAAAGSDLIDTFRETTRKHHALSVLEYEIRTDEASDITIEGVRNRVMERLKAHAHVVNLWWLRICFYRPAEGVWALRIERPIDPQAS